MQPYFLPYIGYFQLIHAVDVFVIYDDVNFRKQSWITRNRILVKDDIFRINLRVEGASSFKKINEINRIVENKWLMTIEQSYKRAPYFEHVFPLIEEISNNREKNLSRFLTFSILSISKYLGIPTKFLLSSELKKDIGLSGKDKVIAICKELNATTYINAIGGRELYEKDDFVKENIELSFIKTSELYYKQFENRFIPGLSIIDTLMFNSKHDAKELLKQYKLV